jgi:GNAT superfamily N-acetyltransferase
MSEPYTIAHEVTPDPSAVAHIRAGLSAYNRQQAGDDTFTPITLLVRDHNGAVVGGLLGGTYWGWLVVDILWLADDARHQGIGSQLLQQAEQIAIARGCHDAHLDTMSFQAPDFYEQHGYSIFGVLDDLPRRHRRYFLQKKLTAPDTVTADLIAAHDLVVSLIQAIPDTALDWSPPADDWSLKRIVGHLAHANDFYVMIVDEARAADFGTVTLHADLAGWRQMIATDAAIAQCSATQEAWACFERTYQRMLAVLENVTRAELDRPFVFCRPDAEPLTTTLRQRVVAMAAHHMREHQPHLSDTLERWRATQLVSS